MLELEQVQSKGQNQKHSCNDLGEESHASFLACTLVLGHEALTGAGDCARQTVLAGLKHNDGNQSNGAEHLDNGENDV